MAHILHAGGPWKLESHFRSYSDTTQANTAPGGRFRCLSRSALFVCVVGLDGLGSQPPPNHPTPYPPQVPLFNNTEQSWAGPGKGPE